MTGALPSSLQRGRIKIVCVLSSTEEPGGQGNRSVSAVVIVGLS